jgi:uncharacterized iron-regulated protein
MKKTLFLTLFVLCSFMFAQDKPAYLLYDKASKATTYQELLQKAAAADVVLFGETHNNPISHWLQLQLTKDLHKAKNGKLVLGAEMFEADVQLVINEYLSGYIKESNFEKEARLWDNYATDYKPVMTFAKQNQIPFIATNVPRRYAAAVAAAGASILEKAEAYPKANYFPPLPLEVDMELPSYKNMMTMMGAGMRGEPSNFVAAQAIKDATMAYKISQNAKTGACFLHLNGAYHSDNYEGIVWYLKKYNSSLKVLTITTLEQEDISKIEEQNKAKADFLICVPNDMTKTY